MKLTNTLLIFLVCLGLFLLFVHINRAAIRHWTSSLNAKLESMTTMNPPKKYRFAPNKNDWQNGIDVTATDVKKETLALFNFFKHRKHLVDDAANGPSAAERLVASIPKMSPGVQKPQVPEIDFTSLEKALTPPDTKSDTNTNANTNDNKETMVSSSMTEEYGSIIIEDQDIYKTFNSMKTRETELMDEVFGEYFLSENWNKSKDAMLKTMPIKLQYYDEVYSKVKYNVLQGKEETVFVKNAFSKYFVLITTKYKNSNSKLKQIKQTLYNILRPTFILQKLYAEYITNPGKYTHKTDALFFINKCIECLREDTNTDNLSPSGTIYTFKDDDADYSNQEITADGLIISNSVLMASFLWRLSESNVANFVMSKETFLKNYAVFLEKNREKKYPGVYIFLVKNEKSIL